MTMSVIFQKEDIDALNAAAILGRVISHRAHQDLRREAYEAKGKAGAYTDAELEDRCLEIARAIVDTACLARGL